MPISSALDKHSTSGFGWALSHCEQRFEFARLVANLAAQHGEGHLAQIRGTSFGGLPSRPLQHAARCQQIAQPARRAAKERGFLLEIDVDAAEEDRHPGALVCFVEGQRQIKWDHQGLVAQLAQSGDQRVIAEATAAIHGAGAGS